MKVPNKFIPQTIKILKEFGWLIGIIVGAFISIAITLIPDTVIKVEVLLLFLIFLFICILIVIGVGYYTDCTRISRLDNIPSDTSHKVLKERLIFDNITLEKMNNPEFIRIKNTKIIPKVHDRRNDATALRTDTNTVYSDNLPQTYAETFRQFINHSNEPYIDFEFELQSQVFVPHWQDFEIHLDDLKIDLTEDTAKPKFTATYNETLPDDDPPPICVQESFLVPLQVDSGDDVDFRVNYRTPSYIRALIGETDEITFEITRPTDFLLFEIVLDQKMAEHYKFSKCISRDPRYPRKPAQEIAVEDKSNQRMFDIEDNLKKPTWNDDFISWTLIRPKISYSYSLFFRIVSKNNA